MQGDKHVRTRRRQRQHAEEQEPNPAGCDPELRPQDGATSVCGSSPVRGPAPRRPRVTARLSFCETSGEPPPPSRRPPLQPPRTCHEVSWSRSHAALPPRPPRAAAGLAQ